MKALRTAAIAALSTSLILTAATPAFADDAPADTTAPVIESIGLTPGQFVTPTTIFVPVVSDDTGVVSLETLVDNQHLRKFAIGPKGPRATVNLTGVAEGAEVEVTFRAYDAAGNVAAQTVKVIADPVIPTATLTPPGGTVLATGGPLTMTLSDVSPDVVSISMINSRTGAELAVRTEAPWTFETVASAGMPQLNFKMTDKAGNVGYRYGYYIVDEAPPVVSDLTWSRPFVDGATTKVQGTITTTRGGAIPGVGTLSATVKDLTAVKIEWLVDGTPYSSGFSTITWDDQAGTRKTAAIELRVTDRAGNVTSKVFPVKIDRVAPIVSAVTPGENSLVRGKYFVTNVRVTDPADLYYATVLGLPQIINADGGMAVYPAKDGPLTLNWRLADAVGNESFATRTVIVDTTKPVLKVVKAPKNGAKVKGTVSITATATDKNRISKVQLLVNGNVVATDTKSGYAFRLNTKKYPKKFKVQLRAYDRAGNYVVTTVRTWHR